MPEDPDTVARRLAGDSLAQGDATGWFEQLYDAAARGDTEVPWDRGGPHPLIAQWVAGRAAVPAGRAIVVGAGLGDDAELIAALGYATTAFDISATAVRVARKRYPDSAVHYVVADLLAPPPEWIGAFDLVLESQTVQALPVELRDVAIRAVTALVAPGGTLVVNAAARDDVAQEPDGPPWPLTRAEIDAFAAGDLVPVGIERVPHPQYPENLRWLAEFAVPASGRTDRCSPVRPWRAACAAQALRARFQAVERPR